METLQTDQNEITPDSDDQVVSSSQISEQEQFQSFNKSQENEIILNQCNSQIALSTQQSQNTKNKPKEENQNESIAKLKTEMLEKEEDKQDIAIEDQENQNMLDHSKEIQLKQQPVQVQIVEAKISKLTTFIFIAASVAINVG